MDTNELIRNATIIAAAMVSPNNATTMYPLDDAAIARIADTAVKTVLAVERKSLNAIGG